MTSEYRCGCTPPTYCPTHAFYGCHSSTVAVRDGWTAELPECPACRSERWRSVTLDARATPTRRGAK